VEGKMSTKLLFVSALLIIVVVQLHALVQLEIQFKCRDWDLATDNHIIPHLNSINQCSSDGDESSLIIRYYYTKKGIEGETYHGDQAEIAGNESLAVRIEPDVPLPTAVPTPAPVTRFNSNAKGFQSGSHLSRMIIKAGFESGTDGFIYIDDTFRTNNPGKAGGTYEAGGGYTGGGLRVFLGPGRTGGPTSGGWQYNFNVNSGVLTVGMRYRVFMGKGYESNEYGEVIVNISGLQTSVAKVIGDGNEGITDDSGWKHVSFDLVVESGVHSITIGAYNNNASYRDEWVEVFIDDVEVKQSGITPSPTILPTPPPTSVPTVPPTGVPTSIITASPTIKSTISR
jgi:hypothetical protein